MGQGQHAVRERLGKVLPLSSDRKCGVFLSPMRRQVEYNSVSDIFTPAEAGDPRIPAWLLSPSMEIHTMFWDTYLLLLFWKNAAYSASCGAFFRKKRSLSASCPTSSMASSGTAPASPATHSSGGVLRLLPALQPAAIRIPEIRQPLLCLARS